MAHIDIPIQAMFPESGGSNNAYSVTVAGTNFSFPAIVFEDGTADKYYYGQFIIPDDYSSAPVITFLWYDDSTSGNVEWNAQVSCYTPGDSQDYTADAFDTNNSATVATATTAKYVKEASVTLTNFDSGAAGDLCTFTIWRDDSACTVTSDSYVIGILRFEYTAA